MPRRDPLDAIFQALSHPVRRSIVERVAKQGSTPSGEIAEWFKRKMTWMAVSKHLNVLVDAGLLSRQPDIFGKLKYRYSVENAVVHRAGEWFDLIAKPFDGH